MDIRLHFDYTVNLSTREFLLISKALRGTLKEEEKPEASELQVLMMKSRAAQIKHTLAEVKKLEENLQESA